jgi:hypothetical protein
MKTPLFCLRTVKVHSRTRTAELSKRHAPLQTCTPRKLIDSFPLLATDFVSRAPAIGAPVNVAMDETPQDIPIRVPRIERSGQILGKQDPGSVTSPAEKKPVKDVTMSSYSNRSKKSGYSPHSALKARKDFSVLMLIQHNDKMPEMNAHAIHANMIPTWCATYPLLSRPKNDAAIAMTRMYKANSPDTPRLSCA